MTSCEATGPALSDWMTPCETRNRPTTIEIGSST